MNFKKGFTLIEIIIVIGIMAVLTAIIIPSLTAVRAKNRDTERIADIGTIQLGLLNYYSKNDYYPTSIDPAVNSDILQYITHDALYDSYGSLYTYVPLTRNSGGSAPCTSYHLGAALEAPNSQIDLNDQFNSTDNISDDGHKAMNGYVWCDGYSGPGLAPGVTADGHYSYNIHPN